MVKFITKPGRNVFPYVDEAFTKFTPVRGIYCKEDS